MEAVDPVAVHTHIPEDQTLNHSRADEPATKTVAVITGLAYTTLSQGHRKHTGSMAAVTPRIRPSHTKVTGTMRGIAKTTCNDRDSAYQVTTWRLRPACCWHPASVQVSPTPSFVSQLQAGFRFRYIEMC